MAGLLALLVLLLAAFGRATNAFYPQHDFLDHVVTLNSIWAKESIFFGHLDELPRILNGTVPAGALGISDLSIPHFLYTFMPTSAALGVSEITGRTFTYALAYLLITAMLGSNSPAKWAGVVAGLGLALMPYWPNQTWTVAALTLCLLALLRLRRSDDRSGIWVAALAIAPHLAYFAWGGFLQPIIAVLVLLVAIIRSRAPVALAVGVGVNIFSSVLSGLALISVLLSDTFVSHREDWPKRSVIDPAALPSALTMYPRTFLRGTDSYGTFFSIVGPTPVVYLVATAILLVLVGSVLIGVTPWFRNARRGRLSLSLFPRGLRRPGVLLLTLLALQAGITLIAVSENSGLTAMVTAFPVPFQISRVIALAPLIWALIAGICSYFIFYTVRPRILKAYGTFAVLTLISFAVIIHPSISSAIRTTIGLPPLGGVSTFDNYFREDSYREILHRVEAEGLAPITLSLGLDPMVAVQNGLTSLDGYVYNYPLDYKRRFTAIVEDDLSQLGGRLEYFRDWGSRVYLFDRGVPASDLKFNWCAAGSMGAEVLLSGRPLPGLQPLSFIAEIGGIFVYQIQMACP